MLLKNCIVVDLDGTLSDCSARRYLVEGKHRDYEAFHARLGEDPPNNWCRTLLKAMNNFCWIILVSARPKKYTGATHSWLLHHHVQFDELHLLREEGDSTPDQELKRAWLRALPERERILFVVDDRQKVVDMWREEGMTCLQCDRWEEKRK